MNRNSLGRRAAVVLVAAVGAGAGVSTAADRSGNLAENEPGKSISARDLANDGLAAALSPTERALFRTAAADEIGLDLDAARELPSPSTASGWREVGINEGRLVKPRTFTIVPGDHGLCVDFDGPMHAGSVACGPGQKFTEGVFSVYAYPNALNPMGQVQGLLPDGYVSVAAYDESGINLGGAAVERGAYAFKIENPDEIAQLTLVRSDGTAVVRPFE